MSLVPGSVETVFGGIESAVSHLAWCDEADSTDLSNHLLLGHGLTIAGNTSFKKKTHAYLHAGEHGQKL